MKFEPINKKMINNTPFYCRLSMGLKIQKHDAPKLERQKTSRNKRRGNDW